MRLIERFTTPFKTSIERGVAKNMQPTKYNRIRFAVANAIQTEVDVLSTKAGKTISNTMTKGMEKNPKTEKVTVITNAMDKHPKTEKVTVITNAMDKNPKTASVLENILVNYPNAIMKKINNYFTS